MEDLEKLIKKLNPEFTKLNEPLAIHTVVGIGGPAEIWYEAHTTEDFINAIKSAKELNIAVTVLGNGSNTLISDSGIKGLVIKNLSRKIQISEEITSMESLELEKETNNVVARWESATEKDGGRSMYEFKDLDYDEKEFSRVEVRIESGVNMAFALNFLLNNKITGLQWYSRIPGNLGGWVYNNVHGGKHFINEVIKSVKVLDENLNVVSLEPSDLNFGYDKSRFHIKNEIILEATLKLYKGDVNKAKYVAMEWAKRKSIQPSKSTGCIFANISLEIQKKLGYPTSSIGYIIEHVLNLSGFTIGDAAISLAHNNFIENKGNATASDYLEVIKTIQNKAKSQLGFVFKPEIFFLGFSEKQLKEAIS